MNFRKIADSAWFYVIWLIALSLLFALIAGGILSGRLGIELTASQWMVLVGIGMVVSPRISHIIEAIADRIKDRRSRKK